MYTSSFNAFKRIVIKMILTPGLNLLQFSKMQQYLPFSSHTNTHSDSHTDAVIL